MPVPAVVPGSGCAREVATPTPSPSAAPPVAKARRRLRFLLPAGAEAGADDEDDECCWRRQPWWACPTCRRPTSAVALARAAPEAGQVSARSPTGVSPTGVRPGGGAVGMALRNPSFAPAVGWRTALVAAVPQPRPRARPGRKSSAIEEIEDGRCGVVVLWADGRADIVGMDGELGA